ncbi:C40 family peptidase [Paenibacillus sp. GSMTC-2017]|uniref:C40 family peptidase n=1 Tax=Paenibacillus sp. GSMTC-2017 TaxID=2794350 RepID=UPI0018D5BA62|nr:C40 family peptidase [Paenibacillus sp. GSMTC-2017]MBH5318270.1 C40 family peptidase [Paenibacillus sp. GSMTC-2017]
MKNISLLKQIVKVSTCSAIVWSAITFGAANDNVQAATPASIDLIESSKEYIGTPYLYGAQPGSTSAFDCSSFTQYMFKRFNIWLPRTSAAQASMGKKVEKNALSTGDLVFYKTNGKSISHVAIYAGNNQIIHSASSKGVSIANMNSTYWKNKYVTARRVIK